MALFKILKGSRTRLDAQTKIDGYAYFCTDDGSFHIDYEDDSGVLQRQELNAANAKTLTGKTLEEIKAEILAAVPGADTSNLVTLSTEQIITGAKTFTNSKMATYGGGGDEYTVGFVALDYYDGSGNGEPVMEVNSPYSGSEYYKLPTGAQDIETFATQEWILNHGLISGSLWMTSRVENQACLRM